MSGFARGEGQIRDALRPRQVLCCTDYQISEFEKSEIQGHNSALTVSYVPYSLGSGVRQRAPPLLCSADCTDERFGRVWRVPCNSVREALRWTNAPDSMYLFYNGYLSV